MNAVVIYYCCLHRIREILCQPGIAKEATFVAIFTLFGAVIVHPGLRNLFWLPKYFQQSILDFSLTIMFLACFDVFDQEMLISPMTQVANLSPIITFRSRAIGAFSILKWNGRLRVGTNDNVRVK